MDRSDLKVKDGGDDGDQQVPPAEPVKFCPFQSFSFLAPAPGKPIVVHGIPQPNDMQIRTLKSPCIKGDCMLWRNDDCSLVHHPAVQAMTMTHSEIIAPAEATPTDDPLPGGTNETP